MGTCATWCPRKARSIPSTASRCSYQADREERAARRGDLQGAEESQVAVPRDRPGPRGRGHRLASAGDPQGARRAQGQATCTAWCSTRSPRTRSARRWPTPRELSLDLVNAQQARRALDYLVGFNLSPLLWKKVRRGLSAGRVQSPALRMICEREEEIAAFIAQEYWTLDGEGEHTKQAFPLKLIEYRGSKVEQFSFTNETQAREVEQTHPRPAAGADARTLSVLADRPQAAPPQSGPALHHLDAAAGSRAQARLQRAAHHAPRAAAVRRRRHRRGQRRPDHLHAYRLGVAGRRGGAARSARSIAQLYGPEALAEEPRVYKTKSKNAQEAHEAIRPTSAAIVPADIERNLEADQFKLYALIWKRAVACQMAHALFDTVAVDMLAGADGAAAPPAARQRLDADQARLHRGLPGRHATMPRSMTPITCCRR